MVRNLNFLGAVYIHTCLVNDKSYVGQTLQGVSKRLKDHVRHSRLANHPDFRYPFSAALRKYGPSAFQTQVLSLAQTKEQLDNLEKIWIILLQTRRPGGYNLGAGGEGNPGLNHTSETIAKISANRVGKGLGNKNAAVARTAEFKARVSQVHLGRKKPLGFGEKIRKARTGIKRPDVTAANNRRWAAVKAAQHGS